jgi:hypothetical protein
MEMFAPTEVFVSPDTPEPRPGMVVVDRVGHMFVVHESGALLALRDRAGYRATLGSTGDLVSPVDSTVAEVKLRAAAGSEARKVEMG